MHSNCESYWIMKTLYHAFWSFNHNLVCCLVRLAPYHRLKIITSGTIIKTGPLKEDFGSTLNNTSAIKSVAFGASILEKHFSTNRNGEKPMCWINHPMWSWVSKAQAPSGDDTECAVIELIGKLDDELTMIFVPRRLTILKMCRLITELVNRRIKWSGSYKPIIDR